MNAKKECRSAPCKSAAKKSIPHRHDSLVTESQQENDEQPRPDRTTQARPSESTAQMNAFNWFTDHFSNRGKALSLLDTHAPRPKQLRRHVRRNCRPRTIGCVDRSGWLPASFWTPQIL